VHQPITKISLIPQLIRIDGSQSAARKNHHTRDDRRVEEESSGQLATDRPQNRDVQGEHQDGVKDVEGELESLLRKILSVISHPLIWVINITTGTLIGVQNIIGTIFEVIRNKTCRQPVSPNQAELCGEIELKCSNRQSCHEADAIHPKVAITQLWITVNECIREIASDKGDPRIDAID